MILHDKVTVVRRVDTGERDPWGNQIFEDVEAVFRAQVQPLDTRENPTPSGSEVAVTRYRVFLAPSAGDISATDAITWRGHDYEVEGHLEQHVAQGRLHHLEAIMRRQSG